MPEAMAIRDDSGLRWIREWKKPGTVPFRIGREGSDLIAEWGGVGSLRATREGASYSFSTSWDAGRAAEAGIRRTLVEGLIRHLQGRVSLHASAAAIGDVAIVILGESMAGKSTLVAELCTHGGFEMLADDTVFLDESAGTFHVVPTESMHSLREDAARIFGLSCSGSMKASMASCAAASRPVRLGAMVKLVFDERATGATLHRLGGAEGFFVLHSSLFRFVIDDDSATVRDLSGLALLSASAPTFELRRPPFLGALRESAEVLQDLLRRLTAQTRSVEPHSEVGS
jgi:hypothetical protein